LPFTPNFTAAAMKIASTKKAKPDYFDTLIKKVTILWAPVPLARSCRRNIISVRRPAQQINRATSALKIKNDIKWCRKREAVISFVAAGVEKKVLGGALVNK